MSFDPGARLDPGQVRDVRGRMGGGRGLAVGGGGIGLVVAIVYLLLGGDPSALLQGGGTAGDPGPGNSTLQQECRSGADANERADCRIVGYVNSIQEFWNEQFPAETGRSYSPAETVIFSDAVSTACGGATSQVGPFYCPLDQSIYLDLGFFQLLQDRFGASGGRFAEAYVVAHEYGHHVENLLGVLERAQGGGTGADSPAVAIELMADCLAGVWANGAEATSQIQDLTEQDIRDALSAASAVGDDRIQAQTQGQVNPETWTHGSSEQRQQWFVQGYRSGRIADCETFSR
jgi:predicted metalloprotease